MKPEMNNQNLRKVQSKPMHHNPVQKQPVKVEKVKKTDKGIVISFTKA